MARAGKTVVGESDFARQCLAFKEKINCGRRKKGDRLCKVDRVSIDLEILS